jgi:hypothetical protein
MASASGESPTDYHHSWGMCGNDGIITTVKPLYLEHVDNRLLKLILYYFNKNIFKNALSKCSR